MEIEIALLLECLSPYKPLSNIKINEKICISTISLFDKKSPPLEKEHLFIGYATDLPSQALINQCIFLICIANCEISEVYLENPHIKLIILDANAELIRVYNAVNSLLSDERRIKHVTAKLFQAITKDFSLQQMCDLGYELLGNPVTILDNSLKTVACTSDIEIDDAIWTEYKKTGGYISPELLPLFATQNEFKQDFNEVSPFIMDKGKLKYKRMISHMFAGKKVLGTMVVVESEKSFSAIDFQITKMITKTLSLEMKKNSFILYSKGLAYEHFFKDLLDGMHDKSLVQEKVKNQFLVIKENLYILTIDISEFDKTYKTLQYFRESLDEIIFDCKSIIYNDYIVIIIMRNHDSILSEMELERLNGFFKKNNLYGGISRCFHDIMDIRLYFSQAVAAASLSRQTRNESRLSNYKDFIIYHLIDLASQQFELKQLCNESLLKLVEYDSQNNTSYTQNLYQYLIHERNLAHTSLALHLHRNSLSYRIEKIQEIMKVDLDDSDIRLHLLLSYKIIDLL